MSKILGSNPSTIKRTKKPGLTVHTYNNPITEEAEVGGLGYMARHYLKEMGKGRGGGRGVNIQEKKNRWGGVQFSWHSACLACPKPQARASTTRTCTQEVDTGGSEVQEHSQLHSKVETV